MAKTYAFSTCADCGHLKGDHKAGKSGKCLHKTCSCGGFAATSKQIKKQKNPGKILTQSRLYNTSQYSKPTLRPYGKDAYLKSTSKGKSYPYKNPGDVIKSGEWIKAKAIRVHNGRLEILK